MRLHKNLLAVLSIFTCLSLQPANADILYDDGPVTGNGGHTFGAGFVIADTFMLTADSTVSGASFDLQLSGFGTLGTVTSISWSILSSVGNGSDATMGVILASGTSSATNTVSFADCCSVNEAASIALPKVALAAGTYWFQETGVTYSDGMTMGTWLAGAGTSNHWNDIRGYNAGVDPQDSFQVLGIAAIPEPGTALLLCPALLGLALGRRRRGCAARYPNSIGLSICPVHPSTLGE